MISLRSKKQRLKDLAQSSLTDDVQCTQEEVLEQAWNVSKNLHLPTLTTVRLVSGCASILAGMPDLVSYAVFKKVMEDFSGDYPYFARDYIKLVRGELDAADSPYLFDTPYPMRAFLRNKIIRVIASPIAEIESKTYADQDTRTRHQTVTLRIPVSGETPLFMWVEGVFFTSVNPADLIDCIRLRYSQASGLSFSLISRLENLSIPSILIPRNKETLLSDARSADYD